MVIEPPKIDKRKYEDLIIEIKSFIPFYTPEWNISEKDSGATLAKIFTHMLEAIIHRLNKVPKKNFIAFLDTVGIKLLQSQSAKAPVTFFLTEGVSGHVLIPERSQIAAEDVVFEIGKNILATPSKLIKIYSSDREYDKIYESPANIVSGEPVEPFHSELLYDVGKGNREIFIISSEGLSEGDILLVSPEKQNEEYAIVSETADSIVKLLHKLEYDHLAESQVEKVTSFDFYKGKNLQEHILYLGHKDFFNIEGGATITIKISNPQAASKLKDSSIVEWEYWGEAINKEGVKEIKEIDWHPLIILDGGNEDEIQLQKVKLGEVKEYEIQGIKSRWIRCRVLETKIFNIENIQVDLITINAIQPLEVIDATPIKIIQGIGDIYKEKLISHEKKIDVIGKLLKLTPKELASILGTGETRAYNILEAAKKGFYDKKDLPTELDQESVSSADSILPDMAFHNDVPLDIQNLSEKNPIYPFGKAPRLYDTFYIASKEVFSKKDAAVKLYFIYKPEIPSPANKVNNTPQLSWEYWNGKGWVVISENFAYNTNAFTSDGKQSQSGAVIFSCPEDIESTNVNNQDNYWVRVRLVGGDYGNFKDGFDPPAIERLSITYSLNPDNPHNLQQCLTYNNLEFKDVSEQCKETDKPFKPFTSIDKKSKTLYLGFDKKLEKGPISIFFSLEIREVFERVVQKIEWHYYSEDKEWVRLEVTDNTQNLTRPGTIEFFLPNDFTKKSEFGHSIYWLKASYVKDEITTFPKVRGIYANTVFAAQAETIEDEVLGSSDGGKNQKFKFTRIPVITEEIWINEIKTLSDDDRKKIIEEDGRDFILDKKDETGKLIEVWVRWQAVEDFFGSLPGDRHYIIDRSIGEVEFGDGEHGKIPPIGRDNIKTTYKVGGGVKGNVGAYEISALKTSIPYVDKVKNPEPGEGGSDTELIESVFERGPYLIRHRNRAVTEEDFERLAKSASRYIARTKCLIENNKLKIIIIPKGKEDKPSPSLSLIRTVEKHLLDRTLNLILPGSVVVQGPIYQEISITAEVVPESMDIAIPLEKEILKKLKEFLHPLTGGPEKEGWEFGRSVHISDIYALLEGIKGVDHLKELQLNGQKKDEEKDFKIEGAQTVCSGEHSITMRLGG